MQSKAKERVLENAMEIKVMARAIKNHNRYSTYQVKDRIEDLRYLVEVYTFEGPREVVNRAELVVDLIGEIFRYSKTKKSLERPVAELIEALKKWAEEL